MWIVKLIRPPRIDDFRKDFFPRKYRLKADAVELQREVAMKGGVAEVVKAAINER